MNYDHRYHAGNFADVFKHIVLTRILLYLRRKPAPFRIIETHAGHGLYDLPTDAAGRAPEWLAGIGRLDADALSAQARALVQPYLDVVAAPAGGRRPYPGSPALSLRLTRPTERMIFCELHPAALTALEACIGGDPRAKALAIDGYTGLKAFIPPVERRGLVLIDPPFEAPDELDRLAEALRNAHGKWRTGILMAWYPIKDHRAVRRFAANVLRTPMDLLRLELEVDVPAVDGRLVGNGLLVVNPPYTLETEMACLLPELQRQLAAGKGAWRIDHGR